MSSTGICRTKLMIAMIVVVAAASACRKKHQAAVVADAADGLENLLDLSNNIDFEEVAELCGSNILVVYVGNAESLGRVWFEKNARESFGGPNALKVWEEDEKTREKAYFATVTRELDSLRDKLSQVEQACLKPEVVAKAKSLGSVTLIGVTDGPTANWENGAPIEKNSRIASWHWAFKQANSGAVSWEAADKREWRLDGERLVLSDGKPQEFIIANALFTVLRDAVKVVLRHYTSAVVEYNQVSVIVKSHGGAFETELRDLSEYAKDGRAPSVATASSFLFDSYDETGWITSFKDGETFTNPRRYFLMPMWSANRYCDLLFNSAASPQNVNTAKLKLCMDLAKQKVKELAKAEAQSAKNPADTQSAKNPANTQAANDPTNTQSANNPTNTQSANDPTNTQSANNPTNTQSANDPTNTQSASNPANTQSASNPANTQSASNPANTQSASNPANTQGAGNLGDVQSANDPTNTQAPVSLSVDLSLLQFPDLTLNQSLWKGGTQGSKSKLLTIDREISSAGVGSKASTPDALRSMGSGETPFTINANTIVTVGKPKFPALIIYDSCLVDPVGREGAFTRTNGLAFSGEPMSANRSLVTLSNTKPLLINALHHGRFNAFQLLWLASELERDFNSVRSQDFRKKLVGDLVAPSDAKSAVEERLFASVFKCPTEGGQIKCTVSETDIPLENWDTTVDAMDDYFAGMKANASPALRQFQYSLATTYLMMALRPDYPIRRPWTRWDYWEDSASDDFIDLLPPLERAWWLTTFSLNFRSEEAHAFNADHPNVRYLQYLRQKIVEVGYNWHRLAEVSATGEPFVAANVERTKFLLAESIDGCENAKAANDPNSKKTWCQFLALDINKLTTWVGWVRGNFAAESAWKDLMTLNLQPLLDVQAFLDSSASGETASYDSATLKAELAMLKTYLVNYPRNSR